MKKIFIILSLFFLLISCSNKQKEEIKVDLNSPQSMGNIEEKEVKQKEKLKIDTIKVKDLSKNYIIKRGGRVIEADYINIKSEVSGEVKEILVKDKQKVKKGDPIIKLRDINSIYSSKLEKESTNLGDIEKKIEEKKMELDNNIYSLEDELEQLKEEYSEETKQAKIVLLTAEVEYEKAKNSIGISESNPKVLKLNEKIKELEYDYMDTIKENKEKSKGYINDINKIFNLTKLQLDNLKEFSSNLFNKKNKYYSFIGARNTIQKLNTKNKLPILISSIDKYNNIFSENVNIENIVSKIEDSIFMYTEALDYIKELENILDNSVESVGVLEKEQLNTLNLELGNIKDFMATTQIDYENILKNTKEFLSTYKNTELDIYNKIDKLKQEKQEFLDNFYSGEEEIVNSYNEKVQTIEEKLDNYEEKIKKLEEKITSAKIEKEIIMNKLKNKLKQKQKNYEEISKEISKFNIKSPINGIISLIEINKGDIVGIGDNLIRMSSKGETEVKVLLKEKEFNMVYVGQEVKIKHYDKVYKGIVYLKSDKKDENNDYTIIIVLDDILKLSGSFVKVEFIFNNSKIILPKKYVKKTGTKTGILEILDKATNKIKKIKVLIGETLDSGLEINGVLNNKGQIINLNGDIELIKK